jgi:F0F1-type ATP synthase membrane subunit b/b'
MAIAKELEEQLRKAKEKNRERLKIIKEQDEEIKELRLQNKFLVDRLEVWAERNFQTRQEKLNMTVDDVVEQSKTKTDYRQQQKAQELAEVVDKAKEGASKLDTSGIKGKE